MKNIGKAISIIGSLAAVLFPPYKVLGNLHWGFLFGKIVKIKGIGSAINIFDHIDYKTLIIELAIINIIGLTLIFLKTKKKSRKRR
ncbi:MAG: hypothetical protein GXO79_09915 [Chlorobi bacterium]|nr:hypothetical protein [Chlorobiota bacterium]